MTATQSAATPRFGTGIGLRAQHHAEVVASRPAVDWFEIHAENYFGGGAPLHYLERVRQFADISVHGVGLSLGSADGIDRRHLDRLKRLVERIEPALVSEHLAWTGRPGLYLNDLLPVPYSVETLDAMAANIDRVQGALKRSILIENPSLYLGYAESDMPEPAFLAELVRRTGCGLLCDVNNIHVTCTNLGGDPFEYLRQLPAEAVGEMHLAGHCSKEIDGTRLLIDDHGASVAPPVWTLFEFAAERFCMAPALIEWDSAIPDFAVLRGEAAEADRRRANLSPGAGDAQVA